MQQNPKLIQFVDTPFVANYTKYGFAFVEISGSNAISLDGYTKVCVQVSGTSITKSFTLSMGKISGPTLCDNVAVNQAADNHIHTYPVIGPQMTLTLNGPPNTTDNVKLWIYLIP